MWLPKAWMVVAVFVAASCSDRSPAELEARYDLDTDAAAATTTLPEEPATSSTTSTSATTTSTTTTTTTVVGGSGDVSVFELTVGLCFDDPPVSVDVDTVSQVDCADPHDNEVFHLFDLADGEYPGTDAVEDAAVDGCLARFDAFVGVEYADSELDVTYLTPTERSWGAGDREVVCMLFRVDLEPMTGSMQGAGI